MGQKHCFYYLLPGLTADISTHGICRGMTWMPTVGIGGHCEVSAYGAFTLPGELTILTPLKRWKTIFSSSKLHHVGYCCKIA